MRFAGGPRRPVPTVATLLAMLALPAGKAHAHLVSTGIGPFYDGVVHAYLAPEGVVSILALGVLAGLAGTAACRAAAVALPLAWLVGSIIGLQSAAELAWPWLTIASFVGLGAAIGLGLRLRPLAVATIAIALGCAHGIVSASGMAQAPSAATLVAGNLAGVVVPAVLGSALVVSVRNDWFIIAVRTLGSWLAAAGILLLGWSLKAVA